MKISLRIKSLEEEGLAESLVAGYRKGAVIKKLYKGKEKKDICFLADSGLFRRKLVRPGTILIIFLLSFCEILFSSAWYSLLLSPMAEASSIIARPIWRQVKAGDKVFEIEVAADDESREQGLMYRKQLPANHGMLFVYPSPRPIEMWMKNTLIPLDVAFIDIKGKIINIETMEPLSLTHHAAKEPAVYSLEMSAGWFKKYKIRPGMKIEGLPDYRYAEP